MICFWADVVQKKNYFEVNMLKYIYLNSLLQSWFYVCYRFLKFTDTCMKVQKWHSILFKKCCFHAYKSNNDIVSSNLMWELNTDEDYSYMLTFSCQQWNDMQFQCFYADFNFHNIIP